MRQIYLFLFVFASATMMQAESGTWSSTAVGTALNYSTSKAIGTPATDNSGKPMTVVYLENLGFQKIGQNTNAEDVTWLRNQGYQVIELDYANNEKAISPNLNQDIIAINSSLTKGSFCGCTCSTERSYILMEGYRIERDVAYYWDDPKVYNWPDGYVTGDSLYMDLVYPANASVQVPTLLCFSYSNSFAKEGSRHKRMYLPYFWGAFNDSFVEGASALGVAWAVCDHPKYCDWGQGKYEGGANKSMGAIEVNPDASRKVKSAIRTIRGLGKGLGLNDQVAVTGFSRASTAASLAIGDRKVDLFEDASRGRFPEESSDVQCALLGSGMFDYEHTLQGSNENTRMQGFVTTHSDLGWAMQGALYTIETKASAPVFFFHNTDDYYKDNNKNPEGLYATQAQYLKAKLDAVGVYNETLNGYGTGHSVPQDTVSLKKMYDFLLKYVSPTTSGIKPIKRSRKHRRHACVDLQGRPVESSRSGISVMDGRLICNMD